MRIRHLVCVFTAAVTIYACAPSPPTAPASPAVSVTTPALGAPQNRETPASAAAVVASETVSQLNEFSAKLYAQVAPSQPGNLAVSPLGSFILLEMLYEGSAGKAHQEIERVVGFSPGSLTRVGDLVESLDGLPSLSLAQKIYLGEKAQLVQAYLAKVEPLLAEPVQVVPFASDPAGAVQVINGWVEARTKGLIKDFLRPLPPLTVSVLVSVLHFQGKWAHQFPPAATLPAPFTPSGGAAYNVNMMSVSLPGWKLLALARGQGVVLPYTDDVEMLLLLPGSGETPDSLLADLDLTVGLGQKPEGSAPVIVDLPRFEFEVPTFELTKAWTGVGLNQTVGDPDLSPMLVLDPPTPLELLVYHKTFLKVNEEGTEAAAATAVAVVRKGGAASETVPQRIRFDRPFAFVLRHSVTGAILMLGRVEKPNPS